MNSLPSSNSQAKKHNHQKPLPFSSLSRGTHSFRSLGSEYTINIQVEHVPDSRLVLFNHSLAQTLNLGLPTNNKDLEQIILKNFAWFKYKNTDLNRTKSKTTRTFFATRYLDSDDKSDGSALGDGRAIWVGEIINKIKTGYFQYLDVVLKGTGITPLAWLNHPKENHKDGQLGLTEAVHEYIYSSAAIANGLSTVGVLAVIELPFYREVDNEKAAIVVRIGNHLRFAHYCYFADNAIQLKQLFDYGLKRNLGLPLAHSVNANDISNYMEFIVDNLASEAAIYFDIHAVHGSPTFGNITSCGKTLDFATFVYTDAHHSNYSYMSDSANLLGGIWGQTEQFFNLFSLLVNTLIKSNFDYKTDIKPVEYFLESFNEKFEQVATSRWLKRVGLSEQEIDLLSINNKEFFYEIVKLIYVLEGSKKIKFHNKKVVLAAFEPRRILSSTAANIKNFDIITVVWEQLFKVNRRWNTYRLTDAKPYIHIYQKAIIDIVNELKASKEDIALWQQRSAEITLSERIQPGNDFFYDSERFIASKNILQAIKSSRLSWNKINEMAEISISKLVDHGLNN